MKLSGKVIKLESGGEFTDKLERVHIRLTGAGTEPFDTYGTFRAVNMDDLQLDDEVEIHVSPVVRELKEVSRAAS